MLTGRSDGVELTAQLNANPTFAVDSRARRAARVVAAAVDRVGQRVRSLAWWTICPVAGTAAAQAGATAAGDDLAPAKTQVTTPVVNASPSSATSSREANGAVSASQPGQPVSGLALHMRRGVPIREGPDARRRANILLDRGPPGGSSFESSDHDSRTWPLPGPGSDVISGRE